MSFGDRARAVSYSYQILVWRLPLSTDYWIASQAGVSATRNIRKVCAAGRRRRVAAGERDTDSESRTDDTEPAALLPIERLE